MHLLSHPERFKLGTRVLLLRGRPKDGLPHNRAKPVFTPDPENFDAAIDALAKLALPGERIYATAGARDLDKAIRLFKERQLAADYDADPHDFYRHLDRRWETALMASTSQAEKLWLFDCDTPDDTAVVTDELARANLREPPYRYATKSGTHIIVQPFERSQLSDRAIGLLHTNPLMLWGY
ncbi:MAG: hypothetical protein K2Y05_00635 [Hyphomicrobiaceae bacterium]|nr:hypothetical protein [Hyphomicrobiaceae bacterium]